MVVGVCNVAKETLWVVVKERWCGRGEVLVEGADEWEPDG
jgi:hypothetical protein